MPSDPPIVIVGAGAAGLMAAIFASRGERPVLVLECTADGGRKILISGGGRCNVLPSVLDPACFISDSSVHLVRHLLAAWPLEQQRQFFEVTLDLPLILEPETGKLFPASNRARDVRDRLVATARANGVRFRFGEKVSDLRPDKVGWQVGLSSGESVAAARVVLATGGLSVPTTGSDGTGLTIAGRLGHAVHATYPALTPLLADPPVHSELAGLSVTATLSARGGAQPRSAVGGFLFTHRGYSGPAVLDLSDVAVRSRQAGGEPAAIEVAWSAVSEPEWQQRLSERSPRSALAVLREELPNRLAERLVVEAGVADRRLSQLRREERMELVRRLVRYRLPWTGDEGYKKAEVTGGGVALHTVDRLSLESRLHPGLFFCGEILDAFGPIGGYNFAWAWATGRAAGIGARK